MLCYNEFFVANNFPQKYSSKWCYLFKASFLNGVGKCSSCLNKCSKWKSNVPSDLLKAKGRHFGLLKGWWSLLETLIVRFALIKTPSKYMHTSGMDFVLSVRAPSRLDNASDPSMDKGIIEPVTMMGFVRFCNEQKKNSWKFVYILKAVPITLQFDKFFLSNLKPRKNLSNWSDIYTTLISRFFRFLGEP